MAPCVPDMVTIGMAVTWISCSAAVECTDAEAPERRAVVAQRDRERQLVPGDRLVVLVEGAELRAPALRGQLAALLEAAPEQRAGRVVVEDHHPFRVHEEGGGRQPCHQVARVNELERALTCCHQAHSTPWDSNSVGGGGFYRRLPAPHPKESECSSDCCPAPR